MEMNIPFTVEDIINKPMEEFNDILSKNGVSEEIINVCRDIRRRGKNKVMYFSGVSTTLTSHSRSRLRTVGREKLIRFSTLRRT